MPKVRTDKPEPYVQAIENGQVVHKAVQPGARGAAQGDALVAVTGLARGEDPALILLTAVALVVWRLPLRPGPMSGTQEVAVPGPDYAAGSVREAESSSGPRPS